MVLKLRVRHALGVETFTLAASGATTPKVIGRARGCDIVVPSMRVASRHCAIFFHQPSRQWLLQNGDSRGDTRGSTSLNGVPLQSARTAYVLRRRDVIELGDDPSPPTLVVEEIGDDPAPQPPKPARPARPAQPARPARPESPTSIDALDVLAQAAASRRRAPRRRTSWGALVGAILAAVAVAGGAFGLWTWRAHRAPRASVPRTIVIEPELPASDAPEPSTAASPATQAGPVAVEVLPDPIEPSPVEPPAVLRDPAGYEGVVAGLSPDDPLRARPEWRAVVAARDDASVARRLQAYQEFDAVPARLTGPLREVVATWVEEELDALWWQRIAALLDEEFALTNRALEVEAELRRHGADPSPADAERLREELAAVRERLGAIAHTLTETLAFAESDAPDPDDAEQLERLRARRDDRAYAAWRREVLRQTLEDATLPWDDDAGE